MKNAGYILDTLQILKGELKNTIAITKGIQEKVSGNVCTMKHIKMRQMRENVK